MYDEQEDAAQLEWCRQWSEEHKKKMTRKMQKKVRRVQHWCNCKLYVKYAWYEFRAMMKEIDQFVDAKKQIIKEIRGLRDKNMIQILTKVYVQFKTVKVASQEMKKSYSYTVELHNKALSAFEDTYKNLTYLT